MPIRSLIKIRFLITFLASIVVNFYDEITNKSFMGLKLWNTFSSNREQPLENNSFEVQLQVEAQKK